MRNRTIPAALLGSALLLLAGCSIPLRSALEKAVQDFQSPIPMISFEDGSGIAVDTAITITYSRSVDPASLVLGGTMAAESDGGAWSQATTENDTLTLKPKTAWSQKSARTLTVDCADPEGFSAASINVTYWVLDGNVYVSGTKGNDIDPGTKAMPKKTIQKAVNTAALLYKTAEVRVAQGTYSPEDPILLLNGISLIGGWKADWSDHETNAAWPVTGSGTCAYPVSLTISSSWPAAIFVENTTRHARVFGFTVSGGAGGTGDPTAGIYANNTSDLVIEGNVIDGGGGKDMSNGVFCRTATVTIRGNLISGGASSTCAGVLCYQGSVTITGNAISGGSSISDAEGQTNGIYCIGSSPTVARNTVYGGNAMSNSSGIILNTGSNAVLYNNVIDGGSVIDGLGTTGVGVISSSPTLRNNTICAGLTGTYAEKPGEIGISLNTGSKPVIVNNIVFTPDPGAITCYRIGISATHDSTPAVFLNNFLFAASDGAFCWFESAYDPVDDVDINTVRSEAAANVADSTDAQLGTTFAGLDNSPRDLHLTGTGPAATGGCIGAEDWGFTDDLDGDTRPTSGSWSMGAYQYP
jgi:hypothetical protein